MFNKKGAELSMTVIVVAILALVILVILLLVVTGRLALFGVAAQECPGVCSGADDFGNTVDCADGYTKLGIGSKYLDKTTGTKCAGLCCISVAAK